MAVKADEADACKARGVAPGMSLANVRERFGPPPDACWDYTWSPSHAHFRLRVVCFSKATVAMVFGGWS